MTGSYKRRSTRLPLTPTLSPLKSGERERYRAGPVSMGRLESPPHSVQEPS